MRSVEGRRGVVTPSRGVLFLVLGLLLVIFQGSMLRTIWPSFVVPNFLVVLVVYLGFYEPRIRGVLYSFLLGLMLDFASQRGLVGPWAGAFVIIYTLMTAISQRVFISSFAVISLAALISSAIGTAAYVALVSGYLHGDPFPLMTIIVEAIGTAVVAPVLFWLLDLLMGRRKNSHSPFRVVLGSA